MLRWRRIVAGLGTGAVGMIVRPFVALLRAGRLCVELRVEGVLQSPPLHFLLVAGFLIGIYGTLSEDVGTSTGNDQGTPANPIMNL